MNSFLPLVTVGVANYNNGPFVIQALESIERQRYPNLELVIVDDGSIDGSKKLIEDWVKKTKRKYKFIAHESNLGLCKTCNEIVINSIGKYISFIGTDDMYLQDKISSQVEVMEVMGDDVAMVYTDTFLMDDAGNRRVGSLMKTHNAIPFDYAPSGNVLFELQQLNFIHGLSILVRRTVYDVVGLYDESLAFEDYDMSLKIAKKFNILFLDNIQCIYRIHDKSFSGKTKDWNELLFSVYIRHLDLHQFKEKAKLIIWNNYLRGDIKSKGWTAEYIKATNEKFRDYYFPYNNINPFYYRVIRKIRLLFHF